MSWTEQGTFLTGSPPTTIVIPISGTAAFSADTGDDNIGEGSGAVTVSVLGGTGYRPAESQASATVRVTDNDAASIPTVTVRTSHSSRMEGEMVGFTVTAEPRQTSPLTVDLAWSDDEAVLASTPPRTVTVANYDGATIWVTAAANCTPQPRGPLHHTHRRPGRWLPGRCTGRSDGHHHRRRDRGHGLPAVRNDSRGKRRGWATGTGKVRRDRNAYSGRPVTVSLSVTFKGNPIHSPNVLTIPTSGATYVSYSTAHDRVGEYVATIEPGTGYKVGSPCTASVTATDEG